VAVVGILSVAPVARLLLEGLAPGGAVDLGPLRGVLAAPATWRALAHTLETAIAGTLLSAALGTSFALLVVLTDVRGKPLLVFGFMLPLMIAPQVTALAWAQAVGPQSALLRILDLAPPLGSPNPLHSREGIALLFGIHHAPLVFLTVRAGLAALPRDLVEAARAAGASPAQVLRTVVFPLLGPALVTGVALAFVSAIGNFGIPALLGIPGRYPVLTTLIYQKLAGFGPAVLAEVAALSLVLVTVAGAGVAVQSRLARRQDVRVVPLSPARAIWGLGRLRVIAEAASGLVLGLVVLIPLAALVATSLIPAHGVPLHAGSATLEHYRYVLGEHAATRRAFVNSAALAGMAAAALVLVSAPLGHFLVRRPGAVLRLVNLAADLPYALPGVVLAIAMILLCLRPLPVLGGIGLYNTPWIILAAYLSRFLALSLRPVLGGYLALDRSLEEAARSAGASFLRCLTTVVLPLIAPAAAAGAILVFLTAFSELTVSALLWSAGAETVGVVVFSLEQAGESVAAAAVAVLIVAVTLTLMLGASALTRRLPPGVLPWQA
jgi:iron(III) transport system permease protein